MDELIGYEAQLSKEQIRRQYGELSRDFATLPLAQVLEKVRVLARKYYACYPLLRQLSVLYLNHFMLAETEQGKKEMLQEASGWCDRILENCSDVEVCSDAAVLKAGFHIQLGNAETAIEVLEPLTDPSRLSGQSSAFLVQAYQLAGETEKARSYLQANKYVDLLNLVGDAMWILILNEKDVPYCEETIRRIWGIMELYHIDKLHPNAAAQLYFQMAVFYVKTEREEEGLEALFHFEQCVDRILKADQMDILHGDDYFNRLDEWIERLPLGSMIPRDKSFIRQSLREAFQHPVFERIRGKEEFQKLVSRLTEGD